MLETPAVEPVEPRTTEGRVSSSPGRFESSTSMRALARVLIRRRRLVVAVVGGLLLVCLLYCLIVPNEYEAQARVALRVTPAAPLNLPGTEDPSSRSLASGQIQLETLAGVLRSDRLAWTVIVERKLYQAPAFMGRFGVRFPGFRPEAPEANAESYLLERFRDRLHVGTVPRTLLVEVRFRSRDARLSADVVNALIAAYGRQQTDLRQQATEEAAGKLESRLTALRARAEDDDRRLAAFQKKHGLLISPQALAGGKPGAAEHLSSLVEVDELGRELAAADSDRILREAESRAAALGDPETVLAFDPRIQTDSAPLPNAFASFMRITANWSRNWRSSASNAVRTFPASWKFNSN